MTDVGNMAIGEWETLLRLVLALIFGGLIGTEREAHGRAAGTRTNILVCMGSAAIILAFQKLYATVPLGADSAIRMDPARAAAGIITGIGFLGAGTIIKGRNFVLGLTTAASIWIVSAIGITLGLGHYLISTEVTVLALLTLMALEGLSHRIRPDRYREIRIEGDGGVELYERVRSKIEALGLNVKDYGIKIRSPEGGTVVDFIVKFKGQGLGVETVKALSQVAGVRRLRWGQIEGSAD
ncbi:MAG: MgtC/SapB family protein [bacterium]|jgi:putative Mg2+ transporter-C (MgtC) family protein